MTSAMKTPLSAPPSHPENSRPGAASKRKRSPVDRDVKMIKENVARVESLLDIFESDDIDRSAIMEYIVCTNSHGSDKKRRLLRDCIVKQPEEPKSLLDLFVEQPNVIVSPDAYMSVREFQIAVRTYASESGYDRPRPSQENLLTSLGEFGVQNVRCTRQVRGQDVTGDFLLGIGLRDTDDTGL
jgi:hypothetical protein